MQPLKCTTRCGWSAGAQQLPAAPGQATSSTAEAAATLCASCSSTLGFFALLAGPPPGVLDSTPAAAGPEPTGRQGHWIVGNLADVPVWCAGGRAMLRAVPHLAATADLDQPPDTAVQEGRHSSTMLTTQLVQAASGIALDCRLVANASLNCPVNAADSVAAADAFWLLHTALCRLAHWQAAASRPFHLTGTHRLITASMANALTAAIRLDAATGESDCGSGGRWAGQSWLRSTQAAMSVCVHWGAPLSASPPAWLDWSPAVCLQAPAGHECGPCGGCAGQRCCLHIASQRCWRGSNSAGGSLDCGCCG